MLLQSWGYSRIPFVPTRALRVWKYILLTPTLFLFVYFTGQWTKPLKIYKDAHVISGLSETWAGVTLRDLSCPYLKSKELVSSLCLRFCRFISAQKMDI
jgi:hypothetical protein